MSCEDPGDTRVPIGSRPQNTARYYRTFVYAVNPGSWRVVGSLNFYLESYGAGRFKRTRVLRKPPIVKSQIAPLLRRTSRRIIESTGWLVSLVIRGLPICLEVAF